MSDERKSLAEAQAELNAALKALFEPPLLRVAQFIDRQLRRWPWLYRKLGGVEGQ